MTYKTNERPPHGAYRCIECGTQVKVDEVNYLMPECPFCKSNEYKQVKDDERIKNYKEVK
ncbi:hypothetical protein [Haloplasma contractile]|uniref:Uncharacterized protein n=1 Tax=Haloplasma contractile SSD-17B TaxID=1033810 RepID=U2FEX5_9MOLU|nr:hypothetical protein [Haloplasma contractile]ERJ11485.1 hypothetical protein HLPCO_002397 [Haloplasma contractile SSD-17B]